MTCISLPLSYYLSLSVSLSSTHIHTPSTLSPLPYFSHPISFSLFISLILFLFLSLFLTSYSFFSLYFSNPISFSLFISPILFLSLSLFLTSSFSHPISPLSFPHFFRVFNTTGPRIPSSCMSVCPSARHNCGQRITKTRMKKTKFGPT